MRVALGAGQARIIGLVVSDIVTLIVGLAIGAADAFAGANAIGAVLYGIVPRDLATLAAAAGVLAGAGTLAALLPARRAASIDPIEVLRQS